MSVLYPDLPLTNYPNNFDNFISFLNITASDGLLIKQYFQAIQNNDPALANQIFAQIPSGSQKILTANGLNKFSQCLVALERFLSDDIEPYVTEKQIEWQQIIEDFSWQGQYSSTTQYYLNNYVTYTTAGLTNLYIATAQPPIGTVPTNTSYWRVLTIRGQKGATGTGLAFTGTWDSATSYVVNNCVTYNDALWGCLVANTNQVPYEGSTYWQLIYKAGVTIYPVSADQPAQQEDGALWFQILT